MSDLLNSRLLVSTLTNADNSVSRAGRNCAVGLRRNPSTARGTNAATTAGDSSAEASPAHPSAAASLTSRGARTTRDKAAVNALNITSSANDHKRAFGRGVVDDDGKRHELCSSPRPHPELDRFLLSEFQEGRRAAFHDIQGRVSAMHLVDAEAVEDEIAARGAEAAVGGSYKQQKVSPTTEGSGGGGGIPELRGADEGAAKTPQRARSPGLPSPGAKPIVPPVKLQPAAAAASPPKHAGGASPRPKKDIVSAAFSAPERFRESKHAPMFPEVGYYRPKYGAVHSRVTHGLLQPPMHSTSRMPKEPEVKDDVAPVGEFVRRAREEVRPRALKEREERRAARAAADDDDDGDGGLTPRKRTAGFPEPSKNSSPAFRSKVAGTQTAALGSAAPDTMYWPLAENGNQMRAGAAIDFKKQTPRPPLAENMVLPDPRSVVTAFSPEKARNAPDISKYSPRKGVGPRHPVPDGPLHPERADTMRYGRTRTADFSAAPLSPRQRADVPGMGKPAGDGGAVSVEMVPTICNPADKSLASPRFDRVTPRKAPKPPVDLPPLELDYTAVDHRSRGAIVRADAGGHGSVFTGNGSGPAVNAEVGKYDPNIDAVRPKTLRTVDFAKATPRKEARANIADITYDFADVSPRVRGNPMIAQQVSRSKREDVLAAKSAAADVTYDVKVPGLTGLGMCDISRQVNRHIHAPGRAAAQRQVDRERKQQDQSAAAAEARMAEKRKNSTRGNHSKR